MMALLFSCKVNKIKQDEDQFYVQEFESKFDQNGDLFNYVFSPSTKFILCIRNSEENPMTYDYSVFDIDSKAELLSSGFIGSGVSWASDSEILIEGTSRVEKQLLFIDVLTGAKRVTKTVEK